MKARCPHCNEWALITSTKVQSPTVTHHYAVCRNHECGHTWRLAAVAEVTLSPSATPNSTVVLPLASHIRRDLIATQMRVSATVEHKPEMSPPTSGDLFAHLGPDGPP